MRMSGGPKLRHSRAPHYEAPSVSFDCSTPTGFTRWGAAHPGQPDITEHHVVVLSREDLERLRAARHDLHAVPQHLQEVEVFSRGPRRSRLDLVRLRERPESVRELEQVRLELLALLLRRRESCPSRAPNAASSGRFFV